MSKIIIGIDPDLEKSGVAILGKSHFELKNLNFADVVDLFNDQQDMIKKVVIEAGWLNKKANFRSGAKKSLAVNEQISKRVGENHATGKLLVQMAQHLGLPVVEVKPTKSKTNSEDFNRLTGWIERTNEHARDAAMLVFKRFAKF